MTLGLVCLEVHLQHGTWPIFSTFYTKDIILHFTHPIALFCALVIDDFAVMVSLLAFLLYEIFLVSVLSIHFIFSYVFMVVYFN